MVMERANFFVDSLGKRTCGSDSVRWAFHEPKPPQKRQPAGSSRRNKFARRVSCSAAPPKAGDTFRVTMGRSADEPIGMDIDVADGVSAVVVGISGGAVLRWNEWRPELALQPNDRIVAVNGTGGNATALVLKLKSETSWDLIVQRPLELKISLPAGGCEEPDLGLSLRAAKHSAMLLVTGVADGPIKEWNSRNPNSAVRQHDRILQLSGARGSPARLRGAQAASAMEMLVLRYP